MKRTLILLIFAIYAMTAVAQEEKNYDVVLKMNGEEHIGNVTEITDDAIKFVHKSESLAYTFKKADVMKITFASGRIEIINEVPETKEGELPAHGLESHHNKIAVLPFHYLIDKQPAGEEMTYKVQSECFSFLNNHVGELMLQDPNTTNALLIKAGVTFENIRGFTMGEICEILQVEYIVLGTITQNTTSTTNYSGTSSSGKSEKNKKNTGNIFSAYSSSYSSSTQNFQTSMTMNIYTDNNATIFSKEHTSFWNTNDAYIITLQYMLKRTPIYKK